MRGMVFGPRTLTTSPLTPGVTLLVLAAAIGTMTMACRGSSSASPSPIPRTIDVSFAGAWQGTVNAAGPGATLQLDISQFGENLGGSWTMSMPSANGSDSGSMTGRIVGGAMSLVLHSASAACPMQVSGTLESDTRMSGTFSTFSAVCSSGLSTPIVLERR